MIRNIINILSTGSIAAMMVHVLGIAAVFGTQVLLARALGVKEFGYYVYAFTWITVVAIFCRLGLQIGTIRFTASYRNSSEWALLFGLIIRSVQVVGTSGLIAAAGFWMLLVTYGSHLPSNQYYTYLYATLILPIVGLLGILQGILKGCQKPAKGIFATPGLPHSLLFVMALIGLVSGEYLKAPTAMLLTGVAFLASIIIATYWIYREIGPSVYREHARYDSYLWMRVSGPLLLVSGMQILIKETDVIMIGLLLGTNESGIYSVAARISYLCTIALVANNAIIAPLIAKLYESGGKDQLQRVLTTAAWTVTIISVPIAVVIVLAGEHILLIFGSAFVSSYSALIILLVGQLINAACGPTGNMMTMTGHQDQITVVITLSATLNIILNAFLIPILGMNGAAIASTISIAAWNIALSIYIWRKMGLIATIWPRRKTAGVPI